MGSVGYRISAGYDLGAQSEHKQAGGIPTYTCTLMNDSLKWGTRVRIGGRTMLRPGFSLVDLEGIVVPSAPNTPNGCMTVAVDWQAGGYTQENGYDTDGLPLFVNVPQEHLEIVTETEAEQEEVAPRPTLSIVKDTDIEPAPANSATKNSATTNSIPTTSQQSRDEEGEEAPAADETSPPDEPPTPEERPRLRLI